jgi:penicillin amidase
MSFDQTPAGELQLTPRTSPETLPAASRGPVLPPWLSLRRLLVGGFVSIALLAILAVGAFFFGRYWLQSAAKNALPQIDGSLHLSGLSAPVTVARDAHGVPSIHAHSLDDLYRAQGFVTAQDRLFQMDLLRRHAAGELAEVVGASAVAHDRLQRTLQIRAAADRALPLLPPAQRHMLEQYAAGVNAAIATDGSHLPVEFRILRYKPSPWTARDSLLVLLAMFQDLTNEFSGKLARESLVARLPPSLRDELEQDLYPVGSWRDHPPGMSILDLSMEGAPIPDVPLDESQSALASPLNFFLSPQAPTTADSCTDCVAGSNNWVVSGAHTASGKPLLSNDMHLTHSLPGIWYQADLAADAPADNPTTPFHAAGVSLPGMPLIVVGHNDHIAWGFTNLGADVQDVYVETTRGSGPAEQFQSTDGSWQPVVHLSEPIKVHGGRDVAFEVLATRHGSVLTPILNPALTANVIHPGSETRTLSLRWTIYDPAAVQLPSLEVNSAHDWPSFLAAFRHYGGPAQNLVYADDQGHIGYHAVGMIPMRGPAPAIASPLLPPTGNVISQQTPTLRALRDPLDTTSVKATPEPTPSTGMLSPVPTRPSAASEWSGYIPFDDLPQVYDPAAGVIATANARTTPDGYAYAIAQNWAAPYRNERIWHLLAHRKDLTAADMLGIQTDIESDFDRMLGERLTYAIDHAHLKRSDADAKTLSQAAELLRTFKGRMATDSTAAAIAYSVHLALWPQLLKPQLQPLKPGQPDDLNTLYVWGERDYALEQILMHTPPRWLPKGFADWNDFLASVVLTALKTEKAPADLTTWHFGDYHTVDIEHPIFAQSPELHRLIAMPTGTNPQPQSGDTTTIKQVGHSFGPSERFTADLANLDHSTLNLVTGQSGNLASPWFLDQFAIWYKGTTLPMPFSPAAIAAATAHTLTLTP